ncbi:MAG: hypothetical protein L3J28_10225 [Candidatus Polarisedimenticolaceae bacterium]|nr:hypothetical protein [Candidatus Polarisedimenticolaceae bacterium]
MVFGLNNVFYWEPSQEAFTAPLKSAPYPNVDFKQLKIGIDNTHIDIAFSSNFTSKSEELVCRMVNEDLAKYDLGSAGREPNNADLEAFRLAYQGIIEVTIDQAREERQSTLISLLTFAITKYLLGIVPKQIELIRSQLQASITSESTQSRGKNLEIHDRLVALAKIEPALRYRVCQRLFRIVQRMESTGLRKIRKSVIGKSWPIPKEVVFNPLLQLGTLKYDELTIDHYPLLCLGENGIDNFIRINRLLTETFANFLPDHVLNKEPYSASQREQHGYHSQSRTDHFLELRMILDKVMGKREFSMFKSSWLDVPSNISRLLQQQEQTRTLFSRDTDNGVANPHDLWPDREWCDFQQRFSRKLYSQLSKGNLCKQIIASSRTPRLYQQLKKEVPIRDIFHYLAGDLSKKQLSRRLNALSHIRNQTDVIRALDAVTQHIRRTPAAKQHEYLTQFIKEFLILRRDLKHAYFAYQMMSHLRILQNKNDLALSRANGSLYEFHERKELKKSEKKIRAHVVLKADLRGSTEITRTLLAKKLNPATHFGINFFEPITKTLESFGAVKVFVEGDALILSILESDGISFHWLTVAHACGLARKILAVMDAQNAQNRVHGLPSLELGIGISFSDEPPAYLYDEKRRIMISPAINQADRLSSCSSGIRRPLEKYGLKNNHIEVMLAKRSGPSRDEDESDKLIRYNVNGIELDAPSFFKLKKELVLRRIKTRIPGHQLMEHYHIGRYPDLKGLIHWVIVREAPIRLWNGEQLGEADPSGRHFYEVVTDPNLIAKIKSKLSSKSKRR